MSTKCLTRFIRLCPILPILLILVNIKIIRFKNKPDINRLFMNLKKNCSLMVFKRMLHQVISPLSVFLKLKHVSAYSFNRHFTFNPKIIFQFQVRIRTLTLVAMALDEVWPS